MPYMCKMENVGSMPQIKYKVVSGNTGNVNDLGLGLLTTRYQVISCCDMTYKYICMPVYSNLSNRWWARVFSGSLEPVTNVDVALLVVYLDYGEPIYTGE